MNVSRRRADQRRLRTCPLSIATTLRGEAACTSFLGSFSAMPNKSSRRRISAQTSSGRTPACAQSTTRLYRRSALSRTTASGWPCMASITTSTASSASFLAILARPARKSRAVRDFAGSDPRAAVTASYRRAIESVIRQRISDPAAELVNGGLRSFLLREQRSIAAGRRRIDGHHLLDRQPMQVIRAAGLWSGARQTTAAERLATHHRADHVTVDVDIAVRKARGDACHRRL